MDLKQIEEYDFEKLYKVIVVLRWFKEIIIFPLYVTSNKFSLYKEDNTNKWEVKSLDSEVRQTELNPSPATYQYDLG